MSKVILISILAGLTLVHYSINAQALLNNGNTLLTVEDGALLHVEGDIIHENDGLVINSGVIELENNWTNNNPTPGFNVHIAGNGIVKMIGNNQYIGGTTPSRFHDLQFDNVTVKTLYADAWVDSMLYLNDVELKVNAHVMHVRNTNPNAIQWNSGFVSGDSLAGYLARSTNRNSAYMYPVGSLNLNNIYRAVEMVPSSSDSSVYAVRLAGVDPEFDFSGTSFTGAIGPFPRTSLGPKVYGVNDRFYHNMTRFYSANTNQTVAAKIFYFSTDEIFPYEFNGVSNWSNTNSQWEVDNFGVNFSGGLFNIGNPDKFMLGTIGSFNNDVYSLMVKDKIVANVPQIFSPNADGLNDILYVYGDGVDELEFVIYNRWGEKVFETKDITVGWDGMHRGKKAQPGVYVYYLKATLNTSETIQTGGDITLVR